MNVNLSAQGAPTQAGLPGILAELYGPAGYSANFSVTAAELAYLREAIFTQWMLRIEAKHPDLADAFRAGGLEHYGSLSHLISHETLWRKENRVLPKESVAALTQFEFVKRLVGGLGHGCRISNVAFLSGKAPNYPEIYWRLVRPHAVGDVGALHTDRWSHDTLVGDKRLYDDDETTVKMWLAIYAEPGLNGLYVVPGSHRKEWRIKHTRLADGHPRPVLDEPLGNYAKVLVPTAPGQAILFNDNLLHGGAVNAGDTTRVSVEITFILKRSSSMQ
jgi:hypothetical protein